MDEITNNNQVVSPQNQGITLNLSMLNLKSFAGWATFKAIMEIIIGAFACLGIITAAYGVPQIISGVKLFNAVDTLKKYMATNDVQNIAATLDNMHRYFKLSGIALIVQICFTILVFIAYIAFFAFVISAMPEIFNNMPNY